ncbi:hypothetical protein [Agromyces sp. ZXT2-6]|uniref:hypothetical protein n=1 Tax=Agromyces sp. ZXT2-6 TaxID=3461153 RepID=UPI00405500FA
MTTFFDVPNGPFELNVVLEVEVIPFDMTIAGPSGYPTELSAVTIGWSTERISAVLQDSDGQYHTFETNVPRLNLDDRMRFTPTERLVAETGRGRVDLAGVQFVRLVAVARDLDVELPQGGGANRRSPSFRFDDRSEEEECIQTAALADRARQAPATWRLVEARNKAVEGWQKWWNTNVGTNSNSNPNPPPPGSGVSEPFVALCSTIFDLKPSEIAIRQSRDQRIPDRLMLDFFDETKNGDGGGLVSQILSVNVQLFRSRSFRAVLATGIHEGAHYRHFQFASSVVERHVRENPSGRVGQRLFIEKEIRRGRLSRTEGAIARTILGVNKRPYNFATHPLAQFHAFLGTYPLFARNGKRLDGTISVRNELRFQQLLDGATVWADQRNPVDPIVREVVVREVADFAKRGGQCTAVDLATLAAEVKQLRFHGANPYFQVLLKALTPPPN